MATVSVFGNHARVGSGSDYWGKMHDPFDPRFARSVQSSLRSVVPAVKGDPWCLGYFVDNEPTGAASAMRAAYGLGLGAIGLPAAGSPAKPQILDQLKKKSWRHLRAERGLEDEPLRLAGVDAAWKPDASRSAWSAEFKADMAAFVKELARTYFKTIREELKAADPDHLYLGCRFAWRTEEAVAASAEYCDVVSFNIYDRRVDPAKWRFLTELNRPAIIGEFHVGASIAACFIPGWSGTRSSRAGGDLRRLCVQRAGQPRTCGMPLVSIY